MKTLVTGDSPDLIRTQVRDAYAAAAAAKSKHTEADCCNPVQSGSSCCESNSTKLEGQLAQLYEAGDIETLPEEVTQLSMGCGDPVTLASLQPGMTVLDLGSGGGIDCFLAAKRVGEDGHVIGVDMTPEMIEKARANKAKVGAENVDFRLGEIEHLPVADGVVDVVISNCVINLSPTKQQVFAEAYRVLRPGGRLAVSDIVTDGPLPTEVKQSLSAWAGCIAGAVEAADYVSAIEAAGFVDVQVTPVYMDRDFIDSAAAQLDLGQVLAAGGEQLYKSVFSAKVTAKKPK